jgi:hypothetical protein
VIEAKISLLQKYILSRKSICHLPLFPEQTNQPSEHEEQMHHHREEVLVMAGSIWLPCPHSPDVDANVSAGSSNIGSEKGFDNEVIETTTRR